METFGLKAPFVADPGWLVLQGRLQTAGLRGSTHPSSCSPSLPAQGSWRIQQLSQPSALKVPNHPWGSELGMLRAAQNQQDKAEHPPTGQDGHLTQQWGQRWGLTQTPSWAHSSAVPSWRWPNPAQKGHTYTMLSKKNPLGSCRFQISSPADS